MNRAPKPVLSVQAMGRALRDARRERGWTQAELAERSGVAQPTVSNVERAANAVSLDTLLRLLAVLELELAVRPRASNDLAAIWDTQRG
jgi:HTH-type transcriptional regulator / antitoxin HipB